MKLASMRWVKSSLSDGRGRWRCKSLMAAVGMRLMVDEVFDDDGSKFYEWEVTAGNPYYVEDGEEIGVGTAKNLEMAKFKAELRARERLTKALTIVLRKAKTRERR